MNENRAAVLIAVLIFIFIIAFAWDCWPLTARVTWDVGDEPDLAGYTFFYRVDSGPWIPHRHGYVVPLGQMTQQDGRTGRYFAAPDNGKTFRVVPLAVDTSGNVSICGLVVVMDTFHQDAYTEPCEGK